METPSAESNDLKARLDASHSSIAGLSNSPPPSRFSRRTRIAIVGGIVVLIAALIGGWWWTNRPAETIYMEAAIIIQETKHYTVLEDGSCQGTRPGYRGGNDVTVILDSGDEHDFVMEPGVVDGSTCHLAFTGDIPLSDTYTARVGRYETDPLDRGPNTRLVGTGETDETFLRAPFIADPWDPWAADT